MKILVLSDSHSGLSIMRRCIDSVRPDYVIHLGDYMDDGQALAQEYFHIPFYQVPGNCDRFRCLEPSPEILKPVIGGVRLYMTHGHLHHVKQTLSRLVADAREAGATCALFGHTHEAYCELLEDGLWLLNPGACGSWGGSCGLIEIENEKIIACRILRQADMEGQK